MIGYKTAWPVIRLLPPEFAHQLALLALRMPAPSIFQLAHDPFDWQGLRFRNRVGIAAGFDKNAIALRGIESLGAGFVEVGTILVKPWRGNDVRPRVKRITSTEAIWNRLGFPSLGLDRIRKNLEAFPREVRNGLVVGCNIGPHPGNVREAKSVTDYLTTARDEMLQLAPALYEHADFFVVNLSSPNTPGLRNLLQSDDLSERLFHPLRQAIRQCDSKSKPPRQTPLLVKLPPEDADRVPWSCESLKTIVEPLVASDACDGFVAVNTSSRLAEAIGEESGGISGGPLRTTALQVVRHLRHLIGAHRLIVGSGGITNPEHGAEFIKAGSNLVEIYSGLVYRGPGLIADSAAELIKQSGLSVPALS
ncbi:MAG: dihydroorotate dehydrogenase (quinone) [Isosphaeraceae bacterium]|jgi:dihydroorotate dehydrogenase